MGGNQKYQNKYLILWKKQIPIKEYIYILTERKRIRTTEEKNQQKSTFSKRQNEIEIYN